MDLSDGRNRNSLPLVGIGNVEILVRTKDIVGLITGVPDPHEG